ncbi:MAG: insulinase family protein [Bacteroidales bacterium]|nr:insulinase family protein [Bacteroidales bacterium]
MTILKTAKQIAAVLCFSTSIVAIAQQQPQLLPIDPQVIHGQLENGLTYYIRHNEEPRERANFYIAQKVGSVQEEESQRGLAHFLEHMCFNGTKHFPGNKIVSYCESIGVKFGQNLNAYTSTDETVYNINDVPTNISSNIDSCLLILRDWSDGLLLETAEIDKERGVIHEEWRMRTSATMRILNRNLEALYPGSRYGKRMPIGLMSVVDNFNPDELRAYYHKWYRPDLQAIIVVGDFDADDMEKRIKETFSSIVMPENAAKWEAFPVPDTNEPIYIVDKDPEMTQPQIMVSLKMDAMQRDEKGSINFFVKCFIDDAIGSAINSRLNELVQNPDGPFVYAGCQYSDYLVSNTKSEFGLTVVPKAGRDAEALEVAFREIERARQFGFTGTELYRARESFKSAVESIYENRDKQKNSFFVSKYVRHFIEGNATPGIATEYEIYNMLSSRISDDIINGYYTQSVASVDTNFVLLAIYPEKDDVKVPTTDDFRKAISNARNAQLEAYVDNVKDEPLIAKLPEQGKIMSEQATDFGYTMLTLSNGARLFYKQTDFNNSEVMLSGKSMGGAARINEKNPTDIYTMKMFADIFNQTGLGNFNATELEKKLAGKQVSLQFSLNSTSETVAGYSTPKDLRTLFELLHLAFQGPADDPNGFAAAINSKKIVLENADKDPYTAWIDSLNTTLFPGDPFHKSLKAENLNQFTYDDYKHMYSDRFQSAGDFDFYVTGAFSVDSLRLFAQQYLASLPDIDKREEYKKVNSKFANGVNSNRFTRQMETPQAYLMQIFIGDIDYNVKGEVALNALSSILKMRYTKTIREDAGFAYSVSVSSEMTSNNDDLYDIQIACPFTPSKCDSVLYLIKESIDDIARNGVTQDELDNVKKFELKAFADKQRNNKYWQNSIIYKSFWGFDVRENYEDITKNITSDDIKAFVNGIMLKDNNCTTVIMLPEDMTEK